MRNTVAKMVDDQSCQQQLKQERNDLEHKQKRKEERKQMNFTFNRIVHPDAGPEDHGNTALNAKASTQKLHRSLSGLVPQVAKLRPGGIIVEEDGHLCVSSERPLGQYLIDAARLYEAMSTFRDKQMIEKYLYHNPPLHPRRTLDQSHYWTLKTTKARDRDQVVYRGTNINLELSHKFRQVPKNTMPKNVEPRIDWTESFKNFRVVVQEHDSQGTDVAQDQEQSSPKKPKGTKASWFKWRPWDEKKCDLHWQWAGHW